MFFLSVPLVCLRGQHGQRLEERVYPGTLTLVTDPTVSQLWEF